MRDIYEPIEQASGFGFGGERPVPCRDENAALAGALFRLLDAKEELQKKGADVPDYIGQWNPEDYYADELEAYNRAVDAFAEAVKIVRGNNEL